LSFKSLKGPDLTSINVKIILEAQTHAGKGHSHGTVVKSRSTVASVKENETCTRMCNVKAPTNCGSKSIACPIVKTFHQLELETDSDYSTKCCCAKELHFKMPIIVTSRHEEPRPAPERPPEMR